MHGPGQFTGEINMLSARRSLVRGRVTSDGSELIVVDREDLRTLVQRDSELSEILMRAFILRRVALMAEGSQDLVLLGSRHSAGHAADPGVPEPQRPTVHATRTSRPTPACRRCSIAFRSASTTCR